jgi:S-adenosylmethionine-diacylgycerolhomoserine-N-methlytransferase
MACDHGRLMDDVYRYQRYFYDLTRKYYLLGRDHLISHMDVSPGEAVLEIACGTGRNLATIRRHYPDAKLYGMDISEQMLITARAKLGDHAVLAQGDACSFEAGPLFGRDRFDHIVLSYSLSMIPDWRAAIAEAARHLAPGGQLHVVDFGTQARLPGWFRRVLLNWLARFHVEPRNDLETAMFEAADQARATAATRPLFRSYAFYGRLTLDATPS